MIRSTVRWIRAVLPPWWAVLGFLLFYLIVEGLYLWIAWLFGFREAEEQFRQMRQTTVGFGCAGYGLFRFGVFHPLFRPDYRRWLEVMPWTSDKPLPMGPIHVVPQDLVVLGTMWLLMHDPEFAFQIVCLSFLVPYLILSCVSLRATGLTWTAYGLAFGLGLVARMAAKPYLAVGVAAVLLYPLALAGLRTSLRRFPWDGLNDWERALSQFKSKQRELRAAELGWPLDRLKPALPKLPFGRTDGVLFSLLVGWVVYSAMGPHVEMQQRYAALGPLYGAVFVGCVLGRLFLYCQHHWPPISLWGRIRTFRWIVPGYDKVFVAPICTLIVNVLIWATVVGLDVRADVAMPIGISLMLLVTLNMGPSVTAWQFTGGHRLAPGLVKDPRFVQL